MFHFRTIEQKLTALNTTLDRLMPALTPLGVLFGLILGNRVQALGSWTGFLFATITFIGGLGISASQFGSVVKRPKALLVFLVGSTVIMPMVSYLFASLAFGSNAEIKTGIVLLTAIPTALTGYIWSSIYKGNEPLSLTIILLGTLIAPLATPLIVKTLGGASVAIDSRGMMISLLTLVVIPTTIGSVINTLSGARVTVRITPSLKPFSKIALVMIVIINTAAVSEQLLANLSLSYAAIALSSLLLAISGYPIAASLARLFGFERQETVSLTFAISMRNISAALVLAIQYFPPTTALPVIFGIVFQQSTAALMASLLFGKSHPSPIIAKEQTS